MRLPSRRPLRRALAAALAAGATLSLPAGAGIPLRDAGGHPIRWNLAVEQPNVRSGVVTWYADLRGATDEPIGDQYEVDAITAAFDTWMAVPGGRVKFAPDWQRWAFDRDAQDRVNYLGWQRDVLGPYTLAATFSTSSNGVLTDADTIFNDDERFLSWSTTTPGTETYADVQSAATHEIGHLLGLDHSPVALATMHAVQRTGAISSRTLKPDDAGALLEAYPGFVDPAHGWIYGTVGLGRKKRARGVPVFALDPETDEPEGCAFTDDRGFFKILALPPGEYLLVATPLATSYPYSLYWESAPDRFDTAWYGDAVEDEDGTVPRPVTVVGGIPTESGHLRLRKPKRRGPGEPDDGPERARTISVGSASGGAFEKELDEDWFRLDVPDTQPVAIRVIAWGVGSGTDPDVTVYDGDAGLSLAYNADVRPPLDHASALGDAGVDLDPVVRRFTPPAAGTYYIRVRSQPQGETGGSASFYLLHVLPAPPLATKR